MIVTYTILCTADVVTMNERVNEFIADGWQPQGGIAVTVNEYNDETYFQAMVMEND